MNALLLDRYFRLCSGCSPTARPSSIQPPNETPAILAEALSPPCSLHHLFPPGSWEYQVARFLQRVQEVQCLLHEDLYELVEPLGALASAALSAEQQAQQRAAEEVYQQTLQVIDLTIAHLLELFPTEAAILQQAGFFAGGDAVYSTSSESSTPLTQEL